MIEQRRGRVSQDFRLHASDGHYFWFRLRARPVVGPEGDVVRLVGTLSDVTDQKNALERLLHDAVYDNLTGLPNREIFFDRLELALVQAETSPELRPTVLCIDIDRFSKINETVGVSAGDSILLTMARRLGRLLAAARYAGAHFRRSFRGDSGLGERQRTDRQSCRPNPPLAFDAGDLRQYAKSR